MLFAKLRSSELRIARTFKECAGHGVAEIEELFDDTATALLLRDLKSEDHLRNALRLGIKLRALKLHRDRARHSRILEQALSAMRSDREMEAWREDPERALVAYEDKALAAEFFVQLTKPQRKVFALIAEDRSRDAIATRLKINLNTARNEMRLCEHERELFCKIFAAGRLCGYRSQAISTFLSGRKTTQRVRDQARVHLSHCQTCRAKYCKGGSADTRPV